MTGRESWQLAPGMPADVRESVAARPCQACGHRRDRHAGWMNLYGCRDCDCTGMDKL
jgi:hypothetical protein